MNPTYHDFCVNVLVRMGEEKNVEDGLITHTAAVTSYLKAIPALLNEALALLATAGKYVVKHIDIAQEGGGEGIVRRDLGTLAEDFFRSQGGRSFFKAGEPTDRRPTTRWRPGGILSPTRPKRAYGQCTIMRTHSAYRRMHRTIMSWRSTRRYTPSCRCMWRASCASSATRITR